MVHSDSKSLRHNLFRLKYTELNEIYAMMTLRSFACSLIAVFAPIYLYKLGYSLTAIAFYYMLMYLFEACFEIVGAIGISKVGPKKMIAYSLPLLVVHFWLFLTLPTYHWPLWLIALEGGFVLALFWQAYHYDFSKAKHRHKATREVSRLYIILAVLGAVAPFLGGLIANYLGMSYLLAAVIVLVSLAIIPLFHKGNQPVHHPYTFSLKKLKISEIKNDIISYVGDGWDGTVGAVFWPLFIFLIVGSYRAVGLVTSLALLVTVTVTYYVGKKADQGSRPKFVQFGSVMEGTIYFVQTLAQTATHVVFINLAHGFSSSIFSSPYVAEYHLHADEHSRPEYMFIMETAIDLGRVLLFFVIGMLTFFMPTKPVLVVALIFGGVGALLVALMPPAKCEICNPTPNKKIRLLRQPAAK